ncbi:MAG: threonine--tRNA ligase, partial [Thaumarchaeota archaeon]
ETEWIPYIVVYGEKEKTSGTLSVRIRSEDKIMAMKPEDLIAKIREETGDKPFKKLPLPKLLSRRPAFR